MLKTIIKFGAEWCSPCKQFAPIFQEVSEMEEYKDVTFSEVDIDEDEKSICEKFFIRSVPTVIFLDEKNNIMKKIIGGVNKSTFITLLNDMKNES